MTRTAARTITLGIIDDATRQLVRVAAAVAAHDDRIVRDVLTEARSIVPPLWVEEVILQSYLFAGFPRALNAMREWRRIAGKRASDALDGNAVGVSARADGERTCEAVYGSMYGRLRENIRELHPALDDWMIDAGYGTVLSRPGLDLPRRELSIVAACAASGQERQLHSHLHGALNVGVAPTVIEAVLDALDGLVDAERLTSGRLLFARLA